MSGRHCRSPPKNLPAISSVKLARVGRCMTGEQKLWGILNDKLDTLRASNRLPEAIRVAETALDLAKRAFSPDEPALAMSFEKLGQLLDQSGDRTAAKPYLLKAHSVLEDAKPPDQ